MVLERKIGGGSQRKLKVSSSSTSLKAAAVVKGYDSNTKQEAIPPINSIMMKH